MDGRTDMATVAGFEVDLARAYDRDTHLWVTPTGGGRYRVGFDALAVETNGTVAALALTAPGVPVRRGEPFGTMEAAKFVGPLVLPLSGRVTAVNEQVLADPSLVESDPYRAGWLVEVLAAVPHVPGAPAIDPEPLAGLVTGKDAITEWFTAAVADYRLKGVLAE